MPSEVKKPVDWKLTLTGFKLQRNLDSEDSIKAVR
jgi:hypothetical protein